MGFWYVGGLEVGGLVCGGEGDGILVCKGVQWNP